MTTEANETDVTTLSPDDAFSVLGNDTRMEILHTLGAADEPLSFTELHDRVGTRDSGRFNYHLGKFEGHFVRKTDDGYTLRKAGRRVIEAVLSGAVTDAVVMEPTRLDTPCPYCDAPIEVSYLEERLLIRCTECVGSFGDIEPTSEAIDSVPDGTLTLNHLPSAGFQGQTPRKLVDTALAWSYSEWMGIANDICPRCSGTIEHSVDVCESHDPDAEICSECQTRWAVLHDDRCTNCGHVHRGGFSHHLLGDVRVRSFFLDRGFDPVAPAYEDIAPIYNYEEEVLGTDPFEARFAFSIQEDTLIVTVNDDLDVVEVTETNGSESA